MVGTGYIGIELAGIFNALGTETTVFSRTKHILRHFDEIIRENLLKEMEASGVKFVYESQVKALSRSSEGSPIRVDYESAGKPASLEVDCVLWAIGRAPNIKNLNLEAAGVKTNEKGYIVVDEYQNTSTPGVYAVGDACGNFELTPGEQQRRCLNLLERLADTHEKWPLPRVVDYPTDCLEAKSSAHPNLSTRTSRLSCSRILLQALLV